MRYPQIVQKQCFAALIARYDWRGTRSSIVHDISSVAGVSCPSAVLHNDDTLVTQFKNNKVEYLKQFIFNICPENTNNIGYVTEKPFEAISAGCIPIYWGSFNQPEPQVLNHDAMILWNMFGDNAANLKQVEDLYTHPQLMLEFLHQPRLVENAEDYVIETIHQLENRLRSLYH